MKPKLLKMTLKKRFKIDLLLPVTSIFLGGYVKIFSPFALRKPLKTAAWYTHFFISTWPIKHMKAFFEKIKHIAHEGFCRKK